MRECSSSICLYLQLLSLVCARVCVDPVLAAVSWCVRENTFVCCQLGRKERKREIFGIGALS